MFAWFCWVVYLPHCVKPTISHQYKYFICQWNVEVTVPDAFMVIPNCWKTGDCKVHFMDSVGLMVTVLVI